MPCMKRVLLVEDDPAIAEMVTDWLGGEGFAVAWCARGDEAIAKARDCDIVVLDVMLPGMGGFEVLRRLRSETDGLARLPVIMLTARGDVTDRVVGLELGADDYLSKPFDPRELTARLRAVLRRHEEAEPNAPLPENQKITVDDLEVETAARIARLKGTPLPLTGAEFDVLAVLMRGAGQVLDRDTLCRQAFGRKWTSYDRAVDMHISNLRRKLGPLPDGRERVQSVRGAGYVYVRAGDGIQEKQPGD
jgi:DNA-binding response OmpR family regulator